MRKFINQLLQAQLQGQKVGLIFVTVTASEEKTQHQKKTPK